MAIKTFTSGEVLTAADTNTYLGNAGLVYVAQGTLNLTGVRQNVLGVFSSTYKNYRMVLNITTRSTSNRIQIHYLVGSTLVDTNYYQGGIGSDYSANTVLYFQRSNNDDSFIMDSSAGPANYSIDIMNPQLAVPTRHYGQTSSGGAAPYSYAFGGAQTSSQQMTGFQTYVNTGTATLEYTIYGYRQS